MSKKVNKDRASDIIKEMRLLKEQRQKTGSIERRRLPPKAMIKRIAKSLLNDAGMDLSNADDVNLFLYLIAMHLHGQFKPGAMRKIPYSDIEIVRMAYEGYTAGCKTIGSIAIRLRATTELKSFKQNAVHEAIKRALKSAAQRTLKVPKEEASEIEAMLPAIEEISKSIRTRSRYRVAE